jgi:hypothetical protein
MRRVSWTFLPRSVLLAVRLGRRGQQSRTFFESLVAGYDSGQETVSSDFATDLPKVGTAQPTRERVGTTRCICSSFCCSNCSGCFPASSQSLKPKWYVPALRNRGIPIPRPSPGMVAPSIRLPGATGRFSRGWRLRKFARRGGPNSAGRQTLVRQILGQFWRTQFPKTQ